MFGKKAAGQVILSALYLIPVSAALNDSLIGVELVDREDGAEKVSRMPVLVDKYSMLMKGVESCVKKNDEVVIIDPFNPNKRLIRRVLGTQDDHVKVSNGLFTYSVRVQEGYCFVIENTKTKSEGSTDGVMIPLGLVQGRRLFQGGTK